ncbi:MAG: calcium-binding protein [Solirubrobacterales bacterium]
MQGRYALSSTERAPRRRRFALGAVGAMIAATLLLTPVGSGLGLVGEARASTDIDPCGNGNESTTPMNTALGFQVGSGPAALQCGPKETGFPLLAPEDVSVKAPGAGNVDPAFRTGFPYMIGPDGSEVSYTAITANGLLKTFLESLAGSLTEDAVAGNLFPPESEAAAAGEAVVDALVDVLKAVISDLIQEEEALQGADWDWTVPSKTGTGDWYSWFTWPGTGGALGINPSGDPAITPTSVNPVLINWYSYNPSDSYYQNRPPAPYARVYLGATRVTLKQGPGITATAEALAREAGNDQGPCAGRPLPSCFGGGSASSARASAAASRRRHELGTGKAILKTSRANHSIRGTSRNDEVRATNGDHKVRVKGGHDQVLAGRGDNRLHGGRGSDELISFSGGDRLKGGPGHDLLHGGSGSDVSIGNGGSDSLFDAKGKDRMLAGRGDDRIVVRDEHGEDLVHCGPGTDFVIADPADRIVMKPSAGPSTVRVGAFTAGHTPAGSTCERVHSTVHMPPREPPSIGEHAGRPPSAAEPTWPVLD